MLNDKYQLDAKNGKGEQCFYLVSLMFFCGHKRLNVNLIGWLFTIFFLHCTEQDNLIGKDNHSPSLGIMSQQGLTDQASRAALFSVIWSAHLPIAALFLGKDNANFKLRTLGGFFVTEDLNVKESSRLYHLIKPLYALTWTAFGRYCFRLGVAIHNYKYIKKSFRRKILNFTGINICVYQVK